MRERATSVRVGLRSLGHIDACVPSSFSAHTSIERRAAHDASPILGTQVECRKGSGGLLWWICDASLMDMA